MKKNSPSRRCPTLSLYSRRLLRLGLEASGSTRAAVLPLRRHHFTVAASRFGSVRFEAGLGPFEAM